MSSLDPLKGKAVKAFNQANPAIWKTIHHDPLRIEQCRKIQKRVETLKQNLQRHTQKHRSNWVMRETLKVFEEWHGKHTPQLKPDWAKAPAQYSYLQEARRRVALRFNARLKKVNHIAQRMQNNLAQESMSEEAHVKAFEDFYARKTSIQNRFEQVRSKASKHFAKHKKHWVEQARAQNIQKPERHVYNHFIKRLQRLERIKDAQWRQAHLDFYGKEPPMTLPALQHDFDHSR